QIVKMNRAGDVALAALRYRYMFIRNLFLRKVPIMRKDLGPPGADKWGTASVAGFQLVPDVLLVKQQQLGLDALDVLVLLNITSFWWFRDRPPFLRTNVI